MTNGYKKGGFLHRRLAAHGGKGISVRQLGGGRAGVLDAHYAVPAQSQSDRERDGGHGQAADLREGFTAVMCWPFKIPPRLGLTKRASACTLHPVIAVDAGDGSHAGPYR